jgi:hypothetical protein
MPKEEAPHDGLGFQMAHPEQEDDEQIEFEQLPPECEADKYPVVILRNIYMSEDAENDPSFYEELEVSVSRRGTRALQPAIIIITRCLVITRCLAAWQFDMLQECVKFGTVRRIVTPEGAYYDGSVAVVFTTTVDAQKCAEAMHGRFFDGRQIEVEMQGNLDPQALPARIVPAAAKESLKALMQYGDDGEEGRGAGGGAEAGRARSGGVGGARG